jgi:hypothetical protein
MPDAGGGIGLPSGMPDLPDMRDPAGHARFQSLLGAGQPQTLADGAAPDDAGQARLPATGQAGAPLPPGLAPPVQGAAAGAAVAPPPSRAPGETLQALPRPNTLAPPMPAARPSFDLARPPVATARAGEGAAAAARAGEGAVAPARADGALPPAQQAPQAAAMTPSPAATQPDLAAGPGGGRPAAPSPTAQTAPTHAQGAPQAWSAATLPDAAHPMTPATVAAPALPRPVAAPAAAQPADPLQNTIRATWHAPSHPSAGWLALAGSNAALPPLPPVETSRPRHFQPLRAYRQTAQPALYWVPFPATPKRRLLAYTDLRPVPLDLAPHTPRLACWRLDDTEALILTNDPGEGGDAAALHATLMEHAAPLALLRPGQGFTTWEGSPLWLRLAGIAKPATLGVLLAESAPARLQVMRRGDRLEATWLRDGAVTHTRVIAAPNARPAQLLGDAAIMPGRARTLPGAEALPAPQLWRVQEALAAVGRLEMRLALSSGQTPRHRLAALAGRGRAVLDRVLNGEVHGIDAPDGVALAMALGRLPPEPLAGALA